MHSAHICENGIIHVPSSSLVGSIQHWRVADDNLEGKVLPKNSYISVLGTSRTSLFTHSRDVVIPIVSSFWCVPSLNYLCRNLTGTTSNPNASLWCSIAWNRSWKNATRNNWHLEISEIKRAKYLKANSAALRTFTNSGFMDRLSFLTVFFKLQFPVIL